NTATGALPGDAGGNGRVGAQKIIIFETDGVPTSTATASFVSGSANQSYYKVRYNAANPGGSEYPSCTNCGGATSAVTTQITTIVTQLAANTSAGGYSTTNRPLLLNCIAFGPLGVAAVGILNTMQTLGNVNDGMPSYKIINGNSATITSNLQTAIGKILQDGVQVSLIQ
ncbi:MAG: hypothetical protein ABSG68_21415, partial [Thermoguttaceae bacterium]